jgi:pseudouridine-5'-phosphate glycosidase
MVESEYILPDIQETLGVPVLSFAETDDFPAFYSVHSGFKVYI